MTLAETINVGDPLGTGTEIILTLPADPPNTELPNRHVQSKSAPQIAALTQWLTDKQAANTGSDIIAPIPDWAHRHYTVSPSVSAFQPSIHLFNVLVALEWTPSADDIDELRAGFRQASNFLFDVTNGWMAFGQVIIGGPDLMAAADIQIMASNRLHPRSWVNSIHDDDHHQAIRFGRGLWNDRQMFAIPWNEPEAYRIIIHEWGHYALNFVDEYLSGPKAYQRNGHSFSVIIPEIKPGEESIMSSTEGVSELVTTQWPKLASAYPQIPTQYTALSGPEQLADTLPLVLLVNDQGHLVDAAAGLGTTPLSASLSTDDPQLQTLVTATNYTHTWVYLVRGGSAGSPPERIIAQGSLESRWRIGNGTPAKFRLLGAEANDHVVIISSPPSREPLVKQGQIGATGAITWTDVTPAAFPVIDVLPDAADISKVYVRMRSTDMASLDTIRIAALGSVSVIALDPAQGTTNATHWISAATPISTLDGHIFVRNTDNSIAMTTFSQGGGPPFHTPGPANPITAGSADGSAMLFFYDETLAATATSDQISSEAQDLADQFATAKVVTTMVHNLQNTGLPTPMQSGSYAFSVASNQPLPEELQPTLVVYYDLMKTTDELSDVSDIILRVCKLDDSDNWQPQEYTVSPVGSAFSAMPLCDPQGQADPGGALVAEKLPEEQQRVEYYMVGWRRA